MKKLVIIGGGFVGSIAAKNLEKYFNTTLIDSKDYFEFTPGILRTAIEPKHIKKIQIPHNSYLKKSKVIIGLVKKITENKVILKNKKISFDYLIIASGSSYNEKLVKNNILSSQRAKQLSENNEKILNSKKIVIIGGGITGVELAAEICTKFKDKEISIIHSGTRLLPRMNYKSSDYAEKFLKKHKVRILFNEKVNIGKKILLSSKKEIKADLFFICTGISPNSDFFNKQKDSRGYIQVNEFLQAGINNIFAGGDIVSLNEEKTAQNAEAHAKIIIKNIISIEKTGKPCKKYTSKKRIMVVSLGKYCGILDYKNISISGFIPGIIKTLIEKYSMFISFLKI